MERGRETWWDGRPQAQRRSAAPAAAAAAPSASAGAVASSEAGASQPATGMGATVAGKLAEHVAKAGFAGMAVHASAPA